MPPLSSGSGAIKKPAVYRGGQPFRLTYKIALSQARPRVVRPVMMVMMRQGGGKDCHKAIVYQTTRIFWSCLTLISSQSCFTKRTELQANRFGVYGLDSTRINEPIRAQGYRAGNFNRRLNHSMPGESKIAKSNRVSIKRL